MKVLGLTGSIGMGKSTAAVLLRRLGLPVYDADAAVHRLMGSGGAAVPLIGAAFPGSVVDGAVDRRKLGPFVFGNAAELRRLEAILHPLEAAARRRFLARLAARGIDLAVVDIPLLFEIHAERDCSAVAVVSAPAFLQRQRVMRRPHMTEAKFQGILRQQIPDREKRQRSQFIVVSSLGRAYSLRILRRIVKILKARGKPVPLRNLWIADARDRPRYRNHRAGPQSRS